MALSHDQRSVTQCARQVSRRRRPSLLLLCRGCSACSRPRRTRLVLGFPALFLLVRYWIVSKHWIVSILHTGGQAGVQACEGLSRRVGEMGGRRAAIPRQARARARQPLSTAALGSMKHVGGGDPCPGAQIRGPPRAAWLRAVCGTTGSGSRKRGSRPAGRMTRAGRFAGHALSRRCTDEVALLCRFAPAFGFVHLCSFAFARSLVSSAWSVVGVRLLADAVSQSVRRVFLLLNLTCKPVHHDSLGLRPQLGLSREVQRLFQVHKQSVQPARQVVTGQLWAKLGELLLEAPIDGE